MIFLLKLPLHLLALLSRVCITSDQFAITPIFLASNLVNIYQEYHTVWNIHLHDQKHLRFIASKVKTNLSSILWEPKYCYRELATYEEPLIESLMSTRLSSKYCYVIDKRKWTLWGIIAYLGLFSVGQGLNFSDIDISIMVLFITSRLLRRKCSTAQNVKKGQYLIIET